MNKDIQLQPLSTLKTLAEPPAAGWRQSPAPGGMSNKPLQKPPSPLPQLESMQNRILPIARTLTVKMEEKMMLVQNFIMKIAVFGSQEY
jgi:hypothetical protein